MSRSENHQIIGHQIIGLGHALLDVFHQATDESLAPLGLNRGAMNPIDDSKADHLSRGASSMAPGGSMANSLAIAASIGASAAFLCRTGLDEAGLAFNVGMERAGVSCPIEPARHGRTGRCIVFVTPDAERTMATTLGCCRDIPASSVFTSDFASAKVFAFDGYMLDHPDTRATALAALVAAKGVGPHISSGPLAFMSLGDAACAARNRDLVRYLAYSRLLDGLFANEREAKALTGTERFDSAGLTLKYWPIETYVTRGSEGVSIIGKGEQANLPAARIQTLVDTTGAGDAFAGGVLYGRASGLNAANAAEIGLAAAAHIIQQVGARPLQPLTHLRPAAIKAA